LPFWGNGLMYAYWPWSGSYTVNAPIWMSAHTTQFALPAWRLLPVGDGSGLIQSTGGSYVSYTNELRSDFSIVIETLQGNCLRCAGGMTEAVNLTFKLQNLAHLPKLLHVFSTTEESWFERLADVPVNADGTFSVSLQADSILTVSTLLGNKGNHSNPPPITNFPIPYTDNFESYSIGSLPRYFSDQSGAFSVMVDANKPTNKLLQQQVTQNPGPNAWVPTLDPITVIGATSSGNYTVSVLCQSPPTSGYVQICGRLFGNNSLWNFHPQPPPAVCLLLNSTTNDTTLWELRIGALVHGVGSLQSADAHTLQLSFAGKQINATIDSVGVASLFDSTYPYGLAALGSGYHEAFFDDFAIKQEE